MNQKILKIVNQIKDNLKQIDDEGVYHPLHDEIYDQLSLIEDELYTSVLTQQLFHKQPETLPNTSKTR